MISGIPLNGTKAAKVNIKVAPDTSFLARASKEYNRDISPFQFLILSVVSALYSPLIHIRTAYHSRSQINFSESILNFNSFIQYSTSPWHPRLPRS
jgi:hypothetical protein